MTESWRVLLTGASSFIGCHLAHDIAAAGNTVMAVTSKAAASYESLQARRLDHAVAGGALLRACDLTRASDFEALVADFRPDVCIHHAGWAKDYGSMNYDLDAGHSVNIRPLDHIFRVLAKCDTKAILLTGSSAEYGPSADLAREEDACFPRTPYGLSKLGATLRAFQLSVETGLPARVARVFIPFGPLDAPGKVVMATRNAVKKGSKIDLSPCDQMRDFLHISDLVNGYRALLSDAISHGGFDIINLCGGTGLPVREVLMAMTNAMGADPSLLRFGAIGIRRAEDPFSAGDNGKAWRKLGWRPRPILEAMSSFALDEI